MGPNAGEPGVDRPMQDELSYICDSCGEEIVVPVDATGGSSQSYVEDCPVCCHPSVLSVDIDPDGRISLVARPE